MRPGAVAGSCRVSWIQQLALHVRLKGKRNGHFFQRTFILNKLEPKRSLIPREEKASFEQMGGQKKC